MYAVPTMQYFYFLIPNTVKKKTSKKTIVLSNSDIFPHNII